MAPVLADADHQRAVLSNPVWYQGRLRLGIPCALKFRANDVTRRAGDIGFRALLQIQNISRHNSFIQVGGLAAGLIELVCVPAIDDTTITPFSIGQ